MEDSLAAGTGTGGFAGASGRVDFKDIIGEMTVTYEYRGHIRLAMTHATRPARTLSQRNQAAGSGGIVTAAGEEEQ